jgi:cell division protein FtsB
MMFFCINFTVEVLFLLEKHCSLLFSLAVEFVRKLKQEKSDLAKETDTLHKEVEALSAAIW